MHKPIAETPVSARAVHREASTDAPLRMICLGLVLALTLLLARIFAQL